MAASLPAEIRVVYGADTEVWLFGSRVDDGARGGDIDLYVEVADDTGLLDRNRQCAERRALYRRLGERKVDLVVRPRTREPSPMEVIARRTGVSARPCRLPRKPRRSGSAATPTHIPGNPTPKKFFRKNPCHPVSASYA